MSTTAEDLCRKAHDLCLSVAPELATRPFYVVPMSALPPCLAGVARESDGLAGPALDRVLCGVIGEAWEGRGPAILVKTDGTERDVLSVAVHETAHVLRERWHHCDESDEDALKAAVELAMIADRAAGGARGDECFTENDRGHDAPWFRACVHLLLRARRLGVKVDLWQAFPPGFGPTHAWKMIAALAGECGDWRAWPIAQILQQPYPPRFAALWRWGRPAELEPVSSPAENDPMSELRQTLAELADVEAKATAAYRELVRCLAHNKKPPKPQATPATLAAVHKSAADLDADVRRELDRERRAALFAKQPAIDRERQAVAEQVRVADAALAAAHAQHAALVQPLAFRLEELHRQAMEIEAQRVEQKRTADPALHARAKDIEARQQVLYNARREKVNQLERTRSALGTAGQHAEAALVRVPARGAGLATTTATAGQDVKVLQRRIDVYIGELADMDQQAAALAAEAEAVEAQMLAA
jgi:hypothetical protein